MEKCLLCGSETSKRFAARDFFHPEITKEHLLNWCQNCNFGRLQGDFTPIEVSTFYPNEYFTHGVAEAALPPPTFLERLRTHMAWRRDKGQDFKPEEILGDVRSACDLGCGSGDHLKALHAKGCEVVGVEPDPKARAIAGKICTVFDGTAEDLPEQVAGRDFDVVLMSHVLEHCIDPQKAVANAKSLLKNSGTLVIEVPNNDALGFTMFGKAWPWTTIPRHLSFFTEKSLQTLMQQNGLKIVKKFYTGYLVQFSPWWVHRQHYIWQQIGGGPAPNFGLLAWVHLLRTAFSADARKYSAIRIHVQHNNFHSA